MLHYRRGLGLTLITITAGVACAESGPTDNDALASAQGERSPRAGTGSAASPIGEDSVLMGSGESCQSYTPIDNDMCAGWYCGVTEAQLTSAVDPSATCGGDIQLLCAGSVVEKVGVCARRLKAENFNATNDELRPLVRDCVYEDAEIKAAVPEDCLQCTIDAAACAADSCLVQCLAGDSPACDTCRRAAGCDQGVFSCGGIPAPIK